MVERELDGKKGELLHLIIHTTGGDPFSAVRIMNIIQKKYQKIYVIIPDLAISAGTLIALGADIIYMDDKSMLGPLDLPIEHPKDGSRISALDIQNIITTLSSLTDSIIKERYEGLKSILKLGKSVAAELATKYATEFVKPIIAQIDPYYLQKGYRELRIGLFCAIDLLSSRMMKDDRPQAINTAKKLVNDYPAHEYAILCDEAKNALKLKIGELSKLPAWEKIKDDYIKFESSKYYGVKYAKKDEKTKSK